MPRCPARRNPRRQPPPAPPHRRTAFDYSGACSRQLRLPSTEWTLSYEEGGLNAEGEDLEVVELTFGRTGRNTILWRREGVPGRVPTLNLAPPDAAGSLSPEDLLSSYRRMQQRVDLADVEKSKFLLKPLNIQTGEDDRHQDGVRYEPTEPGYRVIHGRVVGLDRLQKADRSRPTPAPPTVCPASRVQFLILERDHHDATPAPPIAVARGRIGICPRLATQGPPRGR